jgi:hypothetical protein
MTHQRKIDSEKLRRSNEALIDEMVRFNAALERGAYVRFHGGRVCICPYRLVLILG